MEDENGLELSLGLSFGGSSGKSKVEVPSDAKVETASRPDTNAADPSFKNFFQTNIERQDSKGKGTNDPVIAQKDFWTDLAKVPVSARDVSHDGSNSSSQFTRYQELWTSNNKTNNAVDNSNKRKLQFDEVMFQSKQEKVGEYTSTPYKNPTNVNIIRNSHISNPNENVSTGENEVVAESETEGPNSWSVSQHEDKSKSADMSKFTDKHVLSDSNGNGSKGHDITSLTETEVKHGNLSSLRPTRLVNVPYQMSAKMPSTPNTPNPTRFPSPCVKQSLPVVTNEHPSGQALNASGKLQLAFGYSSVQLPTLETGSSWAFYSQPRQVTSSVNNDSIEGAPSADNSDVKISHGSAHSSRVPSPTIPYERKSPDLVKPNGSSSKTQDESKENFSLFKPKSPEGLQRRISTIKPGIASEIKFGGGGSCPNLPWVSATGSNGKTISGVTYKYRENQVKIVCACHGTHMSPEEFAQHANADSTKAAEDNATLANNNSAASAKS